MKGQHGGTKVRLFVSPVKLPVEQVTATSSTSILTSIVDPSLKLTWELFPVTEDVELGDLPVVCKIEDSRGRRDENISGQVAV